MKICPVCGKPVPVSQRLAHWDENGREQHEACCITCHPKDEGEQR